MTDQPAAASPGPDHPLRPSGAHLDLDALADALVGELADDAHLRDCAACRARLDELAAAETDLRASFAALTPPPLPGPVVDRWQEALRSAAGPASARVVALPQPRRSWPVSVAAALALVLAGGLGWTALRDAGLTSADSASTAASGSADDVAESGTTDSADEDTAARAAPEQAEGAATTGAALAQGATGLDYADPGQRAAATTQVLGDGAPDPLAIAPAPGSGAPPDGLDRLREPDALAACLSALEGPPSAVDFARYGDRPALAVLAPQSDDPDVVSVTVVGAGCSPGDPQVLLTTTVPPTG